MEGEGKTCSEVGGVGVRGEMEEGGDVELELDGSGSADPDLIASRIVPYSSKPCQRHWVSKM